MYWSVPQVVKKLVTRYFPNLDSIKVYSKDSDTNYKAYYPFYLKIGTKKMLRQPKPDVYCER